MTFLEFTTKLDRYKEARKRLGIALLISIVVFSFLALGSLMFRWHENVWYFILTVISLAVMVGLEVVIRRIDRNATEILSQRLMEDWSFNDSKRSEFRRQQF